MPYRLDRAFIRIAGPDAGAFLDRLLTQDVTRLEQAGVLYAALLSPQGKLVADMLLWPHDGAIVVEADKARAGDLLRRLAMYKLRAQVDLADVTDAFAALWSEEPFAGAAPDPRLARLGYRALAPRTEAASGAALYEALRLREGAPDLARDAQAEEVFAGEALLEELHGVDFQKGCFVGQENVSRMKRRATTRRKFCPVNFEGPAPAYGAPVRAGAAELGAIRTGGEGRAIALLRLDRAREAREAGAQIEAEGRALTLDPPAWLILPPREPASGRSD